MRLGCCLCGLRLLAAGTVATVCNAAVSLESGLYNGAESKSGRGRLTLTSKKDSSIDQSFAMHSQQRA